MSKLLGDMLEKKYPNFNPDSFDIDNILDWKLWPGFMKLYGMYIDYDYIILNIFCS